MVLRVLRSAGKLLSTSTPLVPEVTRLSRCLDRGHGNMGMSRGSITLVARTPFGPAGRSGIRLRRWVRKRLVRVVDGRRLGRVRTHIRKRGSYALHMTFARASCRPQRCTVWLSQGLWSSHLRTLFLPRLGRESDGLCGRISRHTSAGSYY